MARKIQTPTDVAVGAEFETNNYGRLIVVKYNSSRDVEVEFISTSFKTSASLARIRSGAVKDHYAPSVYGVGFLGDGWSLPISKDAYKCWTRMLERCYSDKWHKKKPTYKGCIVCDEWHSFHNFAKWYEDNYPKDGKRYQLDKDLSCYGDRGKLYSPETCIFVTNAINSEEAHAKSYKFLNPNGEVANIYNLNKFCRENNLHPSHMCQVFNGKREHHKGWTKAD